MILPIIRAYIILTNTTIPVVHDEVQNNSIPVSERSDTSFHRNITLSLNDIDVIDKIRDGFNHTVRFAKSILSSEGRVRDTTIIPVEPYVKNYESSSLEVADKFTSAKPIDYLVAGTEGLAWVVHLFLILSLKRGRNNPRGPLVIRTLIFFLLVISALLLRSHVNNKPRDDVLPNLSLGFSISVVTLLILYIITLIPGSKSERTRVSRNVTVSLRKLLLHNYLRALRFYFL